MNIRIKNRIKAVPMLAIVFFALLISPLQVNAASAKEYTVTYRPGNIAKFSDALVQRYEDSYGEDKVSVSQATGSISITVPAGSYYPEAPQATDIVLDVEHQGRYYVTTGWIPTEETVMQDDDYVVDYAALVDAVNYTIRYVDAASGMDLVTPTMTQGNAADVITSTAKVIQGYEWDAYLKQMILEKGKENVLTFYYTYVAHPKYETVYLEGETIYNVITLPGREIPTQGGQGNQGSQGTDDEGGQGGQGGQGTDDDGDQGGQGTGGQGNQGGEGTGNEGNQGGEGTGSENNQGNQGGNGEEIIEEEPVPLAQFLKENGVKVGLLTSGIAALGALLATTAYQMKKNKKTEEE